MKRQRVPILLLVIAVSVFASTAWSQITAGVADRQLGYSVPREVKLQPITRRLFGNFWRRLYPGGPMQGLSTEGFYPIGWSRDGKFAYYVEPVDEECGCYFAELVIMDLRTDKKIYHFKNDWETWVNADGSPKEDDVRRLWTRNKKEFDQKLREHGIIQTARFALLPAAFTSAGKSYTAKLAKVKGNDPDGQMRVKKVSLDLSSPSVGKKSLYSAEYKGDDLYGAPLDAGLAGVLKSPYESRAAVIVLNVHRGWEGPPHTVGIQINGADLGRGFRK